MYYLINTFAQPARVVSSHRTLLGAVRSDRKLQRDIKAHNGSTSYLPTAIAEGEKRLNKGASIAAWETVSDDEIIQARYELDRMY